MDGYDLWYADEYDYLWYSENLRQRTTLVIANCRYKAVLAAFIAENRKKLAADGIWIYPAEPREAVPVRVIAAMPSSRRSTDSDGESVVCRWGSLFERYKSTARRNPLAFANEHEDLAVEFLKALVEDIEASPDAASYAEDMEAYRRRIAEIEAKVDYVLWDSSENFWNFLKTEVVAGEEVTEVTEKSSVTKKKAARKKPKPEFLPMDEVLTKVRRVFPIKKGHPRLIPNEGGVAAGKAELSARRLDNLRIKREPIPVSDALRGVDDFLGLDEQGRVFFKQADTELIFYYDQTIKVGSKSFNAFHWPVKK